jgi:hypothetical protein
MRNKVIFFLYVYVGQPVCLSQIVEGGIKLLKEEHAAMAIILKKMS